MREMVRRNLPGRARRFRPGTSGYRHVLTILFQDCNISVTEKTQSVEIIAGLMAIDLHLNLKELVLLPAGEWVPDGRYWTAVRVADGFGYFVYGGLARELKIGDAVFTSPRSEVTLRASQLGELRLDFFRVVPQHLKGVLTVLEWRQLERVSTQAGVSCFHYAASESLAQKFARLVALSERDSLVVRTALLHLWASGVAESLPAPGEPVVRYNNLEAKFRRFMGKISEPELATYSMADMAAQLNCSLRHLSRLFRVEFGMTFRKKQTELNLQRACQLLLDPGVTIKSAACDVGYRHISFFNSVFKKRFGLTPSQWRQQNFFAPSDNLLRPGETPPATDQPGARVLDQSLGSLSAKAAAVAGAGSTKPAFGNYSAADAAARGQTRPAGAGGEPGDAARK